MVYFGCMLNLLQTKYRVGLNITSKATEAMFASGMDPSAKVYGVHTHIMFPHLVVLATSVGTVILGTTPTLVRTRLISQWLA